VTVFSELRISPSTAFSFETTGSVSIFSKHSLQEWDLGRRETVPSYRFLGWRGITGLRRVMIRNAVALRPKQERITLAHKAPAPVFIDDVLHCIAALL
jgi:hypothetical protein